MKNIIKITCGLFSILLGFIIFLPLINFLMLVIRTLQANQQVTANLGFFKLAFGFPSFAFLALSWPMFIIYCYHYYKDSNDNLTSFLRLTTIQLYFFPGLVLLYRLTYPQQLTAGAWKIASLGFGLGTITWLINYQRAS